MKHSDNYIDDSIDINGQLFVYNRAKNLDTIKRRKINFADVAYAFFDPYAMRRLDINHSQKEDREQLMGFANKIFFIVFIEKKSHIRIISARKANKDERKEYIVNQRKMDGNL